MNAVLPPPTAEESVACEGKVKESVGVQSCPPPHGHTCWVHMRLCTLLAVTPIAVILI